MRLGQWFGVAALAAVTATAALAASPRVVQACGGCFSPPPPTPQSAQVVTDHRMVLAISQRQTTLWDQIRYSGRPEDFVWVLPVANAATLRIGLADDNFVEALDAYSAPSVTANLPPCFGPTTRPARDASSGLALGCAASDVGAPSAPGAAGESTRVSREGEAVVGPYAIAVIGTKAGGGQLDEWLASHGYQIPPATREVIAYYVDLQFDFIILRLRPGAGVQQMQPVRITTRGYSPVLPLRMIAAGIADKVGLSLMVLSDSRMEAQNFTNATIAERDLEFDLRTNRSNWRAQFDRLLEQDDGRVWITESVQNLFESRLTYRVGWGMPRPGSDAGVLTMTPGDAAAARDAWPFGMDALLGSELDGGEDDAGVGMIMGDGGAAHDDAAVTGDADGVDVRELLDAAIAARDAGFAMEMTDGGGMAPAADPFLDRRYAFAGLADGRAVITRMRTELGAANLDRDLILEASREGMVPVEYVAEKVRNAPQCPRGSACAVVGGAAPAVLEVLGVIAVVLQVRRRRRSRARAS